MMTQLLVPMTYAEKLEQELIQAEKERDWLKKCAQDFLNTLYYEGVFRGEPETMDELMATTFSP